jgi:hypothetical protein
VTGDVLYRRTQIAWPVLAPLVITGAMLVPMFRGMDTLAPFVIVASVYTIVLLLFATLTVTVTSDGVAAVFGIGIVRKWIPLGEIVSFARLRTRWPNGWGIHTYRGGTLYNASGLSAVEFLLTSGRYVGIGTPEPDALVSALQQVIGRTEATHQLPSTRARTWGPEQTIGIVAASLAVVVAGVSIYMSMQPPDTVVGFDSFYVGSGLYRNTIPYPSMQSVTLDDTLPRIGFKTNGSRIGGTMRGNFRVEGWGSARLFINRNAPPFVVITTPETHVVVNLPDPAQTRQLYTSLKAQMRRAAR